MERAKGFEPSTPTLARSCSTPELHPHPKAGGRSTAARAQTYAKCGAANATARYEVVCPKSPPYWMATAIPEPSENQEGTSSARQLQYFRAGTNLWVRIVLEGYANFGTAQTAPSGDIRRGSRDHSRARQRTATAGVGSDQGDDDPGLHEGRRRGIDAPAGAGRFLGAVVRTMPAN